MNDWTQPMCINCWRAFQLGRDEDPNAEPVRVSGTAHDPCLICAMPTQIYVRLDPVLTARLPHAVKRES